MRAAKTCHGTGWRSPFDITPARGGREMLVLTEIGDRGKLLQIVSRVR